MELININEAAALSGKSIQTIRRMIKQKKVKVKKQTTPQGFNYLIIKESLFAIAQQPDQTTKQAGGQQLTSTRTTSQTGDREHRPLDSLDFGLIKSELGTFNSTIQKLISQSERDKENFFSLIKTFQDRIVMLENHIKLLEAPKKKWWQLW